MSTDVLLKASVVVTLIQICPEGRLLNPHESVVFIAFEWLPSCVPLECCVVVVKEPPAGGVTVNPTVGER